MRHRVAMLGLAVATLGGCSAPPPVTPATSVVSASSVTPSAHVTASLSATSAHSARASDVTSSTNPAPSTRPPAPATIPARYRGSWNLDRAGCGLGSEGQLVVAARRVTFYESGGPVMRAAEQDGVLTLMVALTGEGETESRTLTWQLADDGTRLVDRTTGAERYRCPGTSP